MANGEIDTVKKVTKEDDDAEHSDEEDKEGDLDAIGTTANNGMFTGK